MWGRGSWGTFEESNTWHKCQDTRFATQIRAQTPQNFQKRGYLDMVECLCPVPKFWAKVGVICALTEQ